MDRSDLDPILRENEGNDEESPSTTDWSWICFHCHSSRRSVTPSVVCICRTLKSALYRRAFYYSTRLVGGGRSACNLEYQKQVVDRPKTTHCARRLSPQAATEPSVDTGGRCLRQTPLRPFTYCECKTDDDDDDDDATSCPSSSFPSLGNMTSSADVGETHLHGEQGIIPGSTHCGVECDNKSYSRNNDHSHRPISINWLANVGNSLSCAPCSRQKQRPNSVFRIPEIQCNEQQQQQLLHQRSRDNDDYSNRTTTSSTYTRCKLQHRSNDDLKTLLENFRMQVQAVSEDLVRLLEERHDQKQQIDMRNIAIEQLLRLQNKEESTRVQKNVVAGGTEKAGTIQGRGGQRVEDRTNAGRDEQVIVRRTSETKECFFTTLRTIRTTE